MSGGMQSIGCMPLLLFVYVMLFILIIYVAANIWTKERFDKFLDNAKRLAQGDPNLQITEV